VDEDYGKLETIHEKIILEHTSANPNGPLHIGHIRNSILGDSLSRILSNSGCTVETQYYVNDMGRQIAMVVWGLLNLKFDPSKLADQSPKDIDPYQQIDNIIKEHSKLNDLEGTYLNGLKTSYTYRSS